MTNIRDMIDDLRAHRDRIDEAIEALEAAGVEGTSANTATRPLSREEREHKRHVHLGVARRGGHIFTDADRAKAAATRSKALERVCGHPGCGRPLMSTNKSGYCGVHWYDAKRKKPFAERSLRVSHVSPAAKKKMADAMRARWAKRRAQGHTTLG